MKPPSPTQQTADAAERLDTWADQCRDRAIRASIDALVSEADLKACDARTVWLVNAERVASYHYGYVTALMDAAEFLRATG